MGVFTRRGNEQEPPARQRSLVASASKENLDDRKSQELSLARRRESERWQTEAWAYYDEIGEIAYGMNLLADVTSRVRLIPAVVSEGDEGPRPANTVDDLTPRLERAAQSALARLIPGGGSQQDLIRSLALNLSISGEAYLVRSPRRIGSGTPVSWDVRSVAEVQVTGGATYLVSDPRKLQKTLLSEADGYYVARVWRPHPQYASMPSCSMRGVLDLCSELQLLNSTFRATARSRLNSGLLFIPDTLTTATQQTYADSMVDDQDIDDEFESFETELMQSMTTPIADETSASAVVPLLVRGPSDAGDQIKYISFQRSFDADLRERADRVLERILQGIDLPKDIVTGLASVKYSNAIQIKESLYQSHVEPLAQLICSTLTTAYLRPVLEAEGFTREQALRVQIWFDPSSVVASPDLAEASRYAYDNLMISNDAWLHYNGFNESDAPDNEELARRIAFNKGQVLPEYLDKVLQTLAPEQTQAIQEAVAAESPGTALPPELIQALGGKPSDTAPPEEAPQPAVEEPPTEQPGQGA